MQASPDTILFIHGLWLTPRCWEDWAARYASRGYATLAPCWPGLEAGVEALNRDPSPIARLDGQAVVDHYDAIARDLPTPPVIVGHGFGGAVARLLLDRGLGAAGVGLAPTTVRGVGDLPHPSIRSASPVLRVPQFRDRAVPLGPELFHQAFANTVGRAESDALHARYHVPAAGRVLVEGALGTAPSAVGRADRGPARRAPLLVVAFGEDHLVPPAAARHGADRYGDAQAPAAYREFPGRPHLPVAPGWEAVADYVLSWALANAVPGPYVAPGRPADAPPARGRPCPPP